MVLTGLVLVTGQTCLPDDTDEDNTSPPPAVEAQPLVRLETTEGVIVIELFNIQAPLTVANILQYVNEGYYDGTIVHSVVKGKSVSAGLYTEDLAPKVTRAAVVNESNNGLSNTRGRVALLEPDGTDSGTAGFLINLADNSADDFDLETGERGLTVFGRVVSGMDVATAMGQVGTSSQKALDDTTLPNVPIDEIRILRAVVTNQVVDPENRAPIANAGADQTVSFTSVVVLDAGGSGDPDGDEIRFSWRQTSGPAVTLSNSTVIRPSFPAPGVATLTFELTVTDSEGLSSTDTVTITLSSIENDPPIAHAGLDQVVAPGTLVTLDAANSSDPDNHALTFTWVQTGGTTVNLSDPTAQQATFTAPASPGTLTFELTVTDIFGGLATDTVAITVNEAPIADAGADRKVAEKVVVQLKGSGTDTDSGGSLRFAWAQTAGPSVTLSNSSADQPTFTVPEGNELLTFQLTVTDADGATATDSVTLTPVTEPRVRLSTTMGDIVFDLLEDEAPVTATNFLQYIEDGFYPGTIIHRVAFKDGENEGDPQVPFVIQGGGFLPDLSRKIEGLRDPIQNEFSESRSNLRGTVAMAKTSDPDSATSQYFVNVSDNEVLDNPLNSGGFAVFANVIEGMEVVDAISAVERSTQDRPDGGSLDDVPVTDILINAATLE